MTVLRRLDTWLAALPAGGIWALSLALTALVAAVDVATGTELSPSLFYLAPIGVASWYGGRQAGLGFALLCAIALYTADRLTGALYANPLAPLWNAAGRMGIFLLTAGLITGQRRALKRERALASTDTLTGIANRRWFYRMAEVELERAQRYGRPLTLAYLDLDHFKELNDRSGHHAGDEALRVVAEVLRSHVRRTDLVARLGGDEFTILLPETDQAQARTVLDKLRLLLAAEVGRRGWAITCSVGVVTAASPPATVDMLIRSADRLMYRVKHDSRDAVRFEPYRDDASSATPS